MCAYEYMKTHPYIGIHMYTYVYVFAALQHNAAARVPLLPPRLLPISYI